MLLESFKKGDDIFIEKALDLLLSRIKSGQATVAPKAVNIFLESVFDMERPIGNIASYAQEAGISENYLSRQIKHYTGRSVGGWIDIARLTRAGTGSHGAHRVGGIVHIVRNTPEKRHISSQFTLKDHSRPAYSGLRSIHDIDRISARPGLQDGQPGHGTLHRRYSRHRQERTTLTNILQANLSKEGGFAYGLWQDSVLNPVSYNDEGSYRRLSVIEGFKLHRCGDEFKTDVAGSLQLLSDDMHMDQDYTPKSVFTLQQKQLSGAGTLEFTLRRDDAYALWQPQTGLFAFYRLNSMSAPRYIQAGRNRDTYP